VQAVFGAALDRLIPPNEAVPLKGALFVDFEDQVEALVRAVAPTALEERAAWAENAQVGTPKNKPAEQVLRQWFAAGRTPATTAPTMSSGRRGFVEDRRRGSGLLASAARTAEHAADFVGQRQRRVWLWQKRCAAWQQAPRGARTTPHPGTNRYTMLHGVPADVTRRAPR
jgi:hypothetical protein